MRSLGLVTIALICSIGVAAAQQRPARPVVTGGLGTLVSKITQGRANGPKAAGAVKFSGGGATTENPG